MSSDCTRLGQKLSTATPTSDQRHGCMMVENHGIEHFQCGDNHEVMHKTISLLFCLSLLPFAVIFEHISDRQRFSFSCFMHMIVCVVLMPILCA